MTIAPTRVETPVADTELVVVPSRHYGRWAATVVVASTPRC